MNQSISIGTFNLLSNGPAFIIAELSANHNGSLETAIATLKAAKNAGADAVKLQTYTADTITLNSRTDDFKLQQGTLWDGKYLYDLYKEAFTPWEWHPKLFQIAESLGLICFSSPFDKTAVDFLEELKTPAYKIASFEITDIPLIEYIASKGKPVIISTGIADKSDIELSLDACHRMGNDQIILLKCTSCYPAPIEDANLAVIRDFIEHFHVISGVSDHTLGITVPIVAVCFGARVIEKHFTLDRFAGGPDASFSLTAPEFKAMVQAVREAEYAIGNVDYVLSDKQMKSRELSRSLYIVEDIKAGEPFTETNVRSIRPGYGLHPKFFQDILGRKAKNDLRFGQRLRWEDIK